MPWDEMEGDEIAPWLDSVPEPEAGAEAAPRSGPDGAGDAGPDGDELPPWLSWGEEAEAGETGGVADDEDVTEDEESAAAAVDAQETEAAAAELLARLEEQAAEEALTGRPARPRRGGASQTGVDPDALAAVADRLEAIARALRTGPEELLSGAGRDPLELLLAGFALGYAQGRAAGEGEFGG